MKRGFGSDNHSGISPEVMEALAQINEGHALAYGDDEFCAATEKRFKQQFGEQSRVFFAFNGTGCNTLCIDAMTHSQPKLISITQPTELGTLYSLDEIKAIVGLAREYNMYVHIDGARLGNAAVALGCSFKEMTTDLGVDAVSFGGTKNGLMMGEAVVLLNPDICPDFKYRRKQAMQLCSKMRFIAAQFDAYFDNDLWRRNAEHSNHMAQLLYKAVKDIPGVKVVYPVQANGVFAQLPRKVWKELQTHYFFYDWDEDADVVRWMCAFDTTEDDINNFAGLLKELMTKMG